MFLFRTVFWLGLVLALMPVNPADLREGEKPVSPLETVGLARSIASDVGSFCSRNPQSCETGGRLISQIGLKAREGAKFAYAWLDQHYGPEAAASDVAQDERDAAQPLDTVSTGTVEARN